MNICIAILRLVLSAAVCLAIVGCDTESTSENNVHITPSSITLRKGQSVTFVASGGYEYTWSNEGYGRFSTKTGDTTVYTSTFDAGTNSSSEVFETITVISTLPGPHASDTSSGSSSNTTTSGGTYQQQTEAFVHHVAR
jgi:hypothetical protein